VGGGGSTVQVEQVGHLGWTLAAGPSRTQGMIPVGIPSFFDCYMHHSRGVLVVTAGWKRATHPGGPACCIYCDVRLWPALWRSPAAVVPLHCSVHCCCCCCFGRPLLPPCPVVACPPPWWCVGACDASLLAGAAALLAACGRQPGATQGSEALLQVRSCSQVLHTEG